MFRYKTKDFSIEAIKNIVHSYEQHEDPKCKKAFDYYANKHDILAKQPSAPGRPNWKLVTNFCKQIIETYAGYINLGASNTDLDILDENMDVFEEALHDALICGIGYVLCYYDDANLEFVKLNPATTLILYDTSISENVVGAVTWNKYIVYEDGDKKEHVDIYVYDESSVTHYHGNTIDDVKFEGEQNHFIGSVPILEVKASPNYEGIYECVYTLQDAYNYLLSCYEDTRETFNNAFLVISGMGVDSEQADKLIDGTNKILNLPLADGKAYYLTKDDNPQQTTLPVMDRIREDIFNTTSTPNFFDAKFSSASGMSVRMRLTAFVQRCQNMQEWFYKTVIRLREVLGVEFEFKFNSLIPVDTEAQVNAVVALDGIISRETQLTNIPTFVDDPEEEMKRLEAEGDLEFLQKRRLYQYGRAEEEVQQPDTKVKTSESREEDRSEKK